MPEQSKNPQKDSQLAADERPVPSQAEGDRETVEQDMQQKDKADTTGAGNK